MFTVDALLRASAFGKDSKVEVSILKDPHAPLDGADVRGWNPRTESVQAFVSRVKREFGSRVSSAVLSVFRPVDTAYPQAGLVGRSFFEAPGDFSLLPLFLRRVRCEVLSFVIFLDFVSFVSV